MNRADLSDAIWVSLDKRERDFESEFFVAEWDSAGTGTRSAAAARGLRARVVSHAGPAMRKKGSSLS